MKKVVVVESPAKAKTINRYLGKDYTVLASYGHIRDLPSKNGSVKPDDNFSMVWEIEARAKKHLTEISTALKNADVLYLATDPDREGEAIAWHVLEALHAQGKLKNVQVHRIVFHEITKKAIQKALEMPRELNQQLVDAYLARRALDYLVGFSVSPVLWRKLPGARSAGRVQSVALRLIVEREAEIEVFQSEEYWSVSAQARSIRDDAFTTRLIQLGGKKLGKMDLENADQAQKACDAIRAEAFVIQSVDKKRAQRNPAPPFTTSTLQQEAARKLGFGAKRTMQTAQRLYEGVNIGGESTGLITYMRTDSVAISNDAISELRQFIQSEYGKDYLPGTVRTFKNKSKNAQEAHEAIRPTMLKHHPDSVAAYLDADQLKLYTLIWKRTVASQMAVALFDQVTVDIVSSDQKIVLRATGSTLVFDGFIKVYREGVDEETLEESDRLLPILSAGERVAIEKVDPQQHFTQPPPRYGEASLVKKLEELGIGRPSTYASIIQVLQDRSYVRLEKRQFIPEERGRFVTIFLVNFFNRYVQYDFTAHMEEQLDEVSHGRQHWQQVMREFWEGFKQQVDVTQDVPITEVIEQLERDLAFHLFHGIEEEKRQCPTCSTGQLGLKLGRFGAFLGCSQYPECKYVRPVGEAENAEDGEAYNRDEPKVLGEDPETGDAITLRKGPYGFYLQVGDVKTVEVTSARGKVKEKTIKPKRMSIPPGTNAHDVDYAQALQLLALPKVIGVHPETQEDISVSIGRFGPYIKYRDLFVSIPKSEDMFQLSLDRALVLIEQKLSKPPRVPRFPKKAATRKKSTS